MTPEDEPIVQSLETRARLIRLEAGRLEDAAKAWRVNAGVTNHELTILRRRVGNIRSYVDQLFEAIGKPDR